MQIKVFSTPNIIQPIFKSTVPGPFIPKPISLMRGPDRWRKTADNINLSFEGRLKLEWMIFYDTVGNKDAYLTAKHFGIAPKTFYKWFKRFDNGKVMNLQEKSRTPVKRRTSTITTTEEARIIRLRKRHIHYSKKKLSRIYETLYGDHLSAHKVQVIINKFNLYPDKIGREKLKKKLKSRRKKNRIQKLVVKEEHWFLFHLDTIVFYWDHLKRYVLTATDHHGKIAYARMYTTKSSASAKDFLYRLHYLINAPIANVQTDNGSEFYLQFEEALLDLNIAHWFSRARTPEDNAIAERFNQTIQTEWINDGNFTTNVDEFNVAVTEWLIEYNFKRPHVTLDYMTPFEYLEYTLSKQQKLLPMYSARTICRQRWVILLQSIGYGKVYNRYSGHYPYFNYCIRSTSTKGSRSLGCLWWFFGLL